MEDIFRFKQFEVVQSECGLKVNTDAVLLGAIADTNNPENILDIGTGTGVIALMLAQRFGTAKIHAVELDESAATTALKNFKNSVFTSRMSLKPVSFQNYSSLNPDIRFDLIVSNPPFFINSLKNTEAKKGIARHTNRLFFDELIDFTCRHLSKNGQLWIILPVVTGELIVKLSELKKLMLRKRISIHSFIQSEAHRLILSFSFKQEMRTEESLIIYEKEKVYTDQYKLLLKEFLTIF